ncbi:hypothetical protein BUALT_Bualt03G0059200 [Buddleja alternifolia]|uniref:Uncharacterized protein n=1 Tax=Buddleja alternifolia TaxID=168488 RepID=A0AAV6XTM6_9LAMI|nr:hypothetical protein BUALT_Bualt03G0059200 [Buddleja alternifolia]
MGCCVSTSKPSKSKPPHNISKNQSKSPPPSHPLLLEEETVVKEVLSEIIPTPRIPRLLQHNRHNESGPFIKSAPLLPDFSKNTRNGAVPKKHFMAMGNDDVSEEACSTLSESVSISTTLTEKTKEKENYDEIRHRSPARIKNRSFSSEVKRERTVGRSPGRRSEPSPGRARPVTGSGYGRRKDSGESSGRRSRSPVTRSDSTQSKMNLGRSPSARKTGKSPARVGSGLGDRMIRKTDEAGKESGDNKKWPPPTNSNESLENPLVSLECFIFL